VKVKAFGSLVKDSVSAWLNDYPTRFGAALAYYAVFSMAPLAVIGVSIAGAVFGKEQAKHWAAGQVKHAVGDNGSQVVQAMLDSANQPQAGLVATILGVIVLFFGAAGLFGEVQDALNYVWQVEPKESQGLKGFVLNRLLYVIMVLAVALLLLASLIMGAIMSAAMRYIGAWQVTVLGHLANELIFVVIFGLLFAMVFKFLPHADIAWRDVWMGALVTAVLFAIGKFPIALYLGRVSVGSAYGASGSLAVLLVWFYYSSLVFLFGAEFTKVYANKFGSHIIGGQ
jgi:membrane protein